MTWFVERLGKKMGFRLSRLAAQLLIIMGWSLILVAVAQMGMYLFESIDPSTRIFGSTPLSLAIVNFLKFLAAGLAIVVFGGMACAVFDLANRK